MNKVEQRHENVNPNEWINLSIICLAFILFSICEVLYGFFMYLSCSMPVLCKNKANG